MKINVSAFSAKMPNKIAISNTAPKGVQTLQELIEDHLPPGCIIFELLVPVSAYKDGECTWEEFTKAYKTQIRYLNLEKIMRRLCKCLDVDEITLCAGGDEQCHRNILYDMLPEEIRGVRK